MWSFREETIGIWSVSLEKEEDMLVTEDLMFSKAVVLIPFNLEVKLSTSDIAFCNPVVNSFLSKPN